MKKKSLPASPMVRRGSLGGIVIVVLAAMVVLTISCKKIPTEPERRIKTPREMTWTADTLTSPDPTSIQLMMNNILVFSPNDVWVVGWSDVARGLLWRYDGKTWTESNIVADVGGMRVNDVAGYSSNDLWTAGYSGDKIFLGHYNGLRWTRENNMNIKGEILDMTKDPEGNIWAVGRNGVILKYDKTKWIADTIKVGYWGQYPDAPYLLKSVEYYDGKVYALGSIFDFNRGRNIYYFFSGSIHNWEIKDSMVTDSPSSIIRWGYSRLYHSNFDKLYSVGLLGIWEFINTGWNQIYKNDGTIYGISGPSEDYLIAVGDFQQILFNNGNNWENISNLFPQIDRNFVCRNVWTDGYETFIVGYGNVGGYTGTIIFHGK